MVGGVDLLLVLDHAATDVLGDYFFVDVEDVASDDDRT